MCTADDSISILFKKEKYEDRLVNKRRTVINSVIVPLKKKYQVVDHSKDPSTIEFVPNMHRAFHLENDPETFYNVKSVFDKFSSSSVKVKNLVYADGEFLPGKRGKRSQFSFSKQKKELKKRGVHFNIHSDKIPKVKSFGDVVRGSGPSGLNSELYNSVKNNNKGSKNKNKKSSKSSKKKIDKNEKPPSKKIDQRYQDFKAELKHVRQEGIEKYMVTNQEIKQREQHRASKNKAKIEKEKQEKSNIRPIPEHVNWHDEEDLLLSWFSFLTKTLKKAKVSLGDKLETLENYVKIWNAEDQEGNLPEDLSIDNLEKQRLKRKNVKEKMGQKRKEKEVLLSNQNLTIRKIDGVTGASTIEISSSKVKHRAVSKLGKKPDVESDSIPEIQKSDNNNVDGDKTKRPTVLIVPINKRPLDIRFIPVNEQSSWMKDYLVSLGNDNDDKKYPRIHTSHKSSQSVDKNNDKKIDSGHQNINQDEVKSDRKIKEMFDSFPIPKFVKHYFNDYLRFFGVRRQVTTSFSFRLLQFSTLTISLSPPTQNQPKSLHKLIQIHIPILIKIHNNSHPLHIHTLKHRNSLTSFH